MPADFRVWLIAYDNEEAVVIGPYTAAEAETHASDTRRLQGLNETVTKVEEVVKPSIIWRDYLDPINVSSEG